MRKLFLQKFWTHFHLYRKKNVFKAGSLNFEELGIGGLDKEFSSIFRRAFASRVLPTDVVKKLGIKHVKGILLYGPPGNQKHIKTFTQK